MKIVAPLSCYLDPHYSVPTLMLFVFLSVAVPAASPPAPPGTSLREAPRVLSRARRIGPETGHWGQAMLEARGIPGIRVLVGLLSLVKRYPASRLEVACATARSHHGFRLRIPKRSGEHLMEIIHRRHETRSTIMTSNRPIEDWGKLIADVPTATAILDRFLEHADIITITGKSYRLRNQAGKAAAK